MSCRSRLKVGLESRSLLSADGLADNLNDYIDRFSPEVDVFEYFDFKKETFAPEKA